MAGRRMGPLAAIVANADACLSWLGADQPDLARVRKATERIVRDGYRAVTFYCVFASLPPP